jgi:hypothetical protein
VRLFIDTYGHNKSIWRGAGDQARIAAHTEHGSVEFVVGADGSWAVNIGPLPGQAGGYNQIARGDTNHVEHARLGGAT